MAELDGSAGTSGIIFGTKKGVWGDTDDGLGVFGCVDHL